jgi:peptide/nickel transport system substrate-binding protein
MFRWKATAAAAVIAIAALTISGCSGDAGGSSADSGGTLTLGSIASPVSLDAAAGEWANRAPFYQAVYDTVLLATPEGEIAPFLATAWSYNDDNTQLTLTLRDDVTFTDGSALNAGVVVENFQRFKDGASPEASRFGDVASFAAPDDTTVVVTLNAPDPAFLTALTRAPGLIASGQAIDSGADLVTDPIGSGPYILDTAATVADSSYVYTKNPDYWNPDLQHYDKLVINVFMDPTAALNAIKAGEANAVKLANNSSLAEVEGAGWTVQSTELDFQGLLLLDRAGVMNPALGDVRVRQALNYAFDRPGLLTALQQDNGTVTTQVFPVNSPAYDPELDAYYDYDPEKAKSLLAEAGYADGLTIQMPTAAALGTTTYALVQQQLAEVGVTVENVDVGNNLIADLLAPKYAASFMQLEENPDWQLIQFMISPTAIFNPFHSQDPQVDAYIQEIQYGDEATQASVAAELNRYIVEQAWFAPFYRVEGSFATDATTTVQMLPSNIFPNVYDFQPKP